LSSPLDIDKLDYLQRDSLHAGVPYGRNFDAGRLINSLCIHPTEPKLAITEKGRTAAEMMVFARSIMFSEVYWHHAVRSATAMLQRGVWLLRSRIDLSAWCDFDDFEWIAAIRRAADGSIAQPLIEGVFGKRRELYKRIAEFSLLEQAQMHRLLAGRPYPWLHQCSELLAARFSRECGRVMTAADVLIDAPPVKLEVDIAIDVVSGDGGVSSLGSVSPVVNALAHHQFDSQVKRVRVFVPRDLRDELSRVPIVDWLATCIKELD
jgi:HD superfamily phosphohydrolase